MTAVQGFPVSYHAGLSSEDDDLIERRQLLEQVIDTRTFLKAPASGQLDTQVENNQTVVTKGSNRKLDG